MTRALLCGLLALVAGAARADDAKPAAPEAAAYVGQELCRGCHDEQAAPLERTPHAVLADPARPEAQRGCEACHGPGSLHAESGDQAKIRTFDRALPARERTEPCLACHAGAPALHDFRDGEHALAKIACTDCHSVHAGHGARLLRKADAWGLCTSCHLEVRAKFMLTERHATGDRPLPCLECHDPHGSRNRRALRHPNDRACMRCHAEYEGPYVFEHEGVLVEGCARCHDPHGSVNRHLLVRQQVAQLCYECHTVTPPTHVQPSFRDCTRCHVAIHGSNTDPRFFQP
ncbi:MAG TPA: DmsE family decaheme c-type cytochrome [Candidatus Binatia bacterium]|nr:DmsE family decaheme c-type cytochrome [Candidatus Binatia bacterium]